MVEVTPKGWPPRQASNRFTPALPYPSGLTKIPSGAEYPSQFEHQRGPKSFVERTQQALPVDRPAVSEGTALACNPLDRPLVRFFRLIRTSPRFVQSTFLIISRIKAISE